MCKFQADSEVEVELEKKEFNKNECIQVTILLIGLGFEKLLNTSSKPTNIPRREIGTIEHVQKNLFWASKAFLESKENVGCIIAAEGKPTSLVRG